MQVTVFGATGKIGRLVVAGAVENGWTVIAHARSQRGADSIEVRPVVGDLADPEVVRRVIEGSDAVISALGPTQGARDDDRLVAGFRAIVDGMETSPVKRLVALGTISISTAEDRPRLHERFLVSSVRMMSRPSYEAIRAYGKIISDSGLDWTIVRVALLTDKPAPLSPRIRMLGESGGATVSRAAVAHLLLSEAAQPRYRLRAPVISDS
jgi:putative NADH-flavin reductase